MAVKERIRVRLKSYDHTLIDTAAEKIVTVGDAVEQIKNAVN